MNKKKWSSFRKEIVNNNLNGIGQILCYIRGHSENVKTPMFSYDFIIVREILPEKGYLSILKEYVVVKSIPNLDYLFWKITLEIICNLQLCIYIEGMYARKLTLV